MEHYVDLEEMLICKIGVDIALGRNFNIPPSCPDCSSLRKLSKLKTLNLYNLDIDNSIVKLATELKNLTINVQDYTLCTGEVKYPRNLKFGPVYDGLTEECHDVEMWVIDILGGETKLARLDKKSLIEYNKLISQYGEGQNFPIDNYTDLSLNKSIYLDEISLWDWLDYLKDRDEYTKLKI